MGFFLDTAFAATRAAQNLAGAEEAQSGVTAKVVDLVNFMFGRVPLWIAAFIVFIISIGVAKVVKNAVESRIGEKIDEEHQEVLVLAGRISYVSTLAIGITTALKIAGIDLTTILAAVAFGIGFALRDLIMNFIAGIMILMSRQFTIGDFIRVGDKVGKVMEIQGRATILKAVDGTKVIVPNSEIFSNSVVSYTSNPLRRVVVPLYVAYGTDLSYATKIALRVLKDHPKILKKPGPSVIIKDYGDSSIDLVARFWVPTTSGWVKIRSEIIKMMDRMFGEAGINVPFSVTHIETSADMAEELKANTEREKIMKQKLEAELSRQVEESALQGGIANQNVTVAMPMPGSTAGAPSPAAPQIAVTPLAVMPAQKAPVPEGAYADQTEIDAQAMDNMG